MSIYIIGENLSKTKGYFILKKEFFNALGNQIAFGVIIFVMIIGE